MTTRTSVQPLEQSCHPSSFLQMSGPAAVDRVFAFSIWMPRQKCARNASASFESRRDCGAVHLARLLILRVACAQFRLLFCVQAGAPSCMEFLVLWCMAWRWHAEGLALTVTELLAACMVGWTLIVSTSAATRRTRTDKNSSFRLVLATCKTYSAYRCKQAIRRRSQCCNLDILPQHSRIAQGLLLPVMGDQTLGELFASTCPVATRKQGEQDNSMSAEGNGSPIGSRPRRRTSHLSSGTSTASHSTALLPLHPGNCRYSPCIWPRRCIIKALSSQHILVLSCDFTFGLTWEMQQMHSTTLLSGIPSSGLEKAVETSCMIQRHAEERSLLHLQAFWLA